eukprot:ctg_71.g16
MRWKRGRTSIVGGREWGGSCRRDERASGVSADVSGAAVAGWTDRDAERQVEGAWDGSGMQRDMDWGVGKVPIGGCSASAQVHTMRRVTGRERVTLESPTVEASGAHRHASKVVTRLGRAAATNLQRQGGRVLSRLFRLQQPLGAAAAAEHPRRYAAGASAADGGVAGRQRCGAARPAAACGRGDVRQQPVRDGDDVGAACARSTRWTILGEQHRRGVGG